VEECDETQRANQGTGFSGWRSRSSRARFAESSPSLSLFVTSAMVNIPWRSVALALARSCVACLRSAILLESDHTMFSGWRRHTKQ
jgi:hypothetical protein